MAVVAMSADVTRVAEAKIVPDTGTWGNDGGGGGVADEADVVYQNDTAQSRKISTTIIGRDYTHGAGTDMDGTPANTAHYIAKMAVTNYAVLLARASPALHMKVGSDSSNYHTYNLYGSDNYPAKGGWQIIAIAPSVAGYAAEAGDTGSPADGAILYWSILADFSTGSKAENVMIDAIDVGLGLCLVGGDGGSTDGNFANFVTYDEGTVINRWGFVYTEGPVLYITGQLAIGQTSAGVSTLTEFTDSGVTLVWNNGLVTTGFHRLLIDLATASTDIQISNCSFLSQGQINNNGDRGYTSTEDSRPILQVTGAAAATFGLTSCVLDNFASFALNAGCTLTNCVITDSGQIDTGTGATMAGTSVSGYTGAADTAALVWDVASDPNGELDNMAFTKGTNAHHAIEFGSNTPNVITLTGWTVSGFNAADGENDSVLYNNSGGAMTINIIGGTGTFSYKNGSGASTSVVVSPVTVAVHAADINDTDIQNARVFLKAKDGTGPFPFEESITIANSGVTATVTHATHGMTTNDYVYIKGASHWQNNGVFQITYSDASTYTYTMPSDPGSSPTGTITSTFVALTGLTDVNGDKSTSRTFASNQPVTGWVRLTPAYKTAPLFGTINSSTGYSSTGVLIDD